MPLNESKGNMYPWVTHTWNTVKGECPHGCTYCYMKRYGKQRPVRFDEKELNSDLGSGNFIFVGSSCDLFARSIPNKWITDTLNLCESYRMNTYLFQTKNPEGFKDFEIHIPMNSRLCTTIETNRYYPQMGNTPHPSMRSEDMHDLEGWQKYVTIEPIMDFDLDEMVNIIRWCNPVQVNIGADSGGNNLPEPSKDKLLVLIDALQEFTTIARKTNLARLLK
jgi:DNA repair photolyase